MEFVASCNRLVTQVEADAIISTTGSTWVSPMVPNGYGSVGLSTNGAIASWSLCFASLLSLLYRRGTSRDGDRRASRGHGGSSRRHYRRCEDVGDVGVDDDDVVVVVLVQLLREVVGTARFPAAFKAGRSSVGGSTNGARPTIVSPPAPPKRPKWLASTANLEPRARAGLGVGDA